MCKASEISFLVSSKPSTILKPTPQFLVDSNNGYVKTQPLGSKVTIFWASLHMQSFDGGRFFRVANLHAVGMQQIFLKWLWYVREYKCPDAINCTSPWFGAEPSLSLRFKANHLLGPGSTEGKNAPWLLRKGWGLHPARNGEFWADMISHPPFCWW